jgi:hypothetical protein
LIKFDFPHLKPGMMLALLYTSESILNNFEENMNVYSCWHKGNSGYCCRQHNLAWMFVPEIGQIDNNIYKNVAFEDLIFKNKHAREYENEYEARLERSYIAGLLQNILRKKYKPHTIGGLLFCTANF